MKDLVSILTFVAALGCGLVAGIFFAFSNFVMKALARVPPAQGVAAMQSINVVVLNRCFFLVFLGTAVFCLALAVISLVRWQRPGTGYLIVGSLFYLIGTILVTITCNVPRNDALAAVDPSSAEASRVWTNYLQRWTAWNHVRTGAALAAAILFTVGLCRASPPCDVARYKMSSPTTSAVLLNKPEDWPRQFEEQLNAGNLDGMLALYEPEAHFVKKSGETLVGQDAIRNALRSLIEAKTHLQSRVVRATTIGDIAQLYTDFEGTRLDESGKTVPVRNSAIEVLRRQPDGSWQLIMGDPNGRQ